MGTKTVQLPNGAYIRGIPDDVPDAEAVAAFDMRVEELADKPPIANTIDGNFSAYTEDLDPVSRTALSMTDYVMQRLPGMSGMPDDYRGQMAKDNPVETAVGQMAVPLTASLAGGSSIPVQALIAGSLEALKGGDTTALEVGKEASKAALFQGAGNLLSRVVTGIGAINQARKGVTPATTTSQPLRIASETGLGRGLVDKANQAGLFKKFGRVFGVDDLSKGSLESGEALAKAETNIGKLYDDALTLTDDIDVTDAAAALDDLPVAVPGGKNISATLEKLNGTSDGATLRTAHRALRDSVAKMRNNPTLAAFTDDVEAVLRRVERSAAKAGANIDDLGVANQKWKVLRTLDEIPEVWQQGVLNPKTLATKLGRENYKGFGRAIKRGKSPLDGDVDDLISSIKTLAGDPRAVGRSGTPEGLLAGGGGILAGGGLLSGAVDPVTAGGALAAYGIVPPVAAAASVGKPIAAVGNVLNTGAREVMDD